MAHCMAPAAAQLGSRLAAFSFGRAAFGLRSFGARATLPDEPPPQSAREGLPPPFEPPPNNPTSLTPQPRASLKDHLDRIQQAATPLEVHRAYLRQPSRLPPPILAAKFSRLAQLLLASAPPSSSNSSSSSSTASSSASSASSSPSPTTPADGARREAEWRALPGVEALLKSLRPHWDAQLHLFSAAELAACVRAAGETGLMAQASTSAAALPSWDPRSRSLLDRSVEVLVDGAAAELKAAGPQAVLDTSVGLMRAGRTDAATWARLGPLLQAAAKQLSGPKAAEADGVLSWLETQGIKT
ncbi:hypothetical protein HYH03_006869 [Edaphochlamys debaryana]|uniref:Uncharacterized protein n=1 Tax=Edaphochlamys debaryana TaxID=47281 RepID=A0A836C0X3_9CHLO|nr:hypothetical protein HYH03_006869 [Edaphochlamys debaryana]|eukprot:KAG2494934.1 hypothetical protein HYH03_006869 [Edaphochlamys debaryana]